MAVELQPPTVLHQRRDPETNLDPTDPEPVRLPGREADQRPDQVKAGLAVAGPPSTAVEVVWESQKSEA